MITLVKTPICTFCAKTGMLCKTCKTNLNKGKISNLDVELSKVLLQVEKNNASLQNTKFFKSIKIDNITILVGDVKFKEVTEREEVADEIRHELKSEILAISKLKNERKTLDNIFKPMRVVGIDKVYVPDGTYELKIRLKGEKEKLPLGIKKLQRIASEIIEADVRIEIVKLDDTWKIHQESHDDQENEELNAITNEENEESDENSSEKEEEVKKAHENKLIEEIVGENDNKL